MAYALSQKISNPFPQQRTIALPCWKGAEKFGFTSDFGNFKGMEKFDELVQTITHSESIHAKAQTNAAGLLDEAEFIRCLDIAKQAGYEGPLTLVYDGPGDMWDGIERVRKLAEPYC